MMSDKPLGLYLHIPFCASKCPYCDFYSNAGKADYKRYVDALLLHMEDYTESLRDHTVDTVFIGGGTPTVLPVRQLCDLLDAVYDYFNVTDDAEITMEANPATISGAGLKKLWKSGVSRLSMGCQSAVDGELKTLGRIHTWEKFVDSFRAARDAGFDNINVDLMYGIPGQTADTLRESLESVVALGPEHVSLYGLTIEPNTPFGKRDDLDLPDEDAACDMYLDSIDFLESQGYYQYEISNFAKEGRQCRHNLKYWNCGEYLGLGPGAHSYLNNLRFSFKRDTALYIRAMEDLSQPLPILDERYEITPDERIGEYVMLRLRLNDGVDTAEFQRRFGVTFESLYGQYLEPYLAGGFMLRTAAGYALSPVGMCVSNEILSTMLSFDSDIIGGVADGSER